MGANLSMIISCGMAEADALTRIKIPTLNREKRDLGWGTLEFS